MSFIAFFLTLSRTIPIGNQLQAVKDMKCVAFISSEASPLSQAGSADEEGPNIYVGELAKALSARGYSVDIYTRKETRAQKEVIHWRSHIRVIYVDAGPAHVVQEEGLLPCMAQFAGNVLRIVTRDQLVYDVIHAYSFVSGLVACSIKKIINTPYTITFQGLGPAVNEYLSETDLFSTERCRIERFLVQHADWVVAECPQDKADLIRYYQADPAKISLVPGGPRKLQKHFTWGKAGEKLSEAYEQVETSLREERFRQRNITNIETNTTTAVGSWLQRSTGALLKQFSYPVFNLPGP